MKKIHLILLLAIITPHLYAQVKDPFFLQEWTNYGKDSVEFEYLKLDEVGSGIKSSGKNIKGVETLLEEPIILKDWYLRADTLFLIPIQKAPNPLQIKLLVANKAQDRFEVLEEIIVFKSRGALDVEKKSTAKKTFIQRKGSFTSDQGRGIKECISDFNLFKPEPKDALHQLMRYRGFADLLPYVRNCNPHLEFNGYYSDPGYELIIPNTLDKFGVGLAPALVEYHFSSKEYTLEGSSIILVYDFQDKRKSSFFKRMEEEEEYARKINFEGKDLYVFEPLPNLFCGRIYYDDHIYLQYNTGDPQSEKQLRACIASFKYRVG